MELRALGHVAFAIVSFLALVCAIAVFRLPFALNVALLILAFPIWIVGNKGLWAWRMNLDGERRPRLVPIALRGWWYLFTASVAVTSVANTIKGVPGSVERIGIATAIVFMLVIIAANARHLPRPGKLRR